MQRIDIMFIPQAFFLLLAFSPLHVNTAHGGGVNRESPSEASSKVVQGQTALQKSIYSTPSRGTEATEVDGQNLLAQALLLARKERLDDALEIMETGERTVDCRYEFSLLRGAIRAGLGQWKWAIEDYRTALRHRPGSVRALVLLGDALVATGDIRSGITSYSTAINSDPEDYMAYLGRGFAWGEFDEIERSMKDINKGFELLQRRYGSIDADIAVWNDIARETCPASWSGNACENRINQSADTTN